VPRRLWPIYAGANMGHPAREAGHVFIYSAQTWVPTACLQTNLTRSLNGVILSYRYLGVIAVMSKTKNDNLQGTLALLVLKTLEQGPMHGWGITLHIQRTSNEALRVEEGSLYPALHRMEQERWIVSEWGVSENNRRARFYRLTALGRKQLNAERQNWKKITSAVDLVLEFKST
jgi:PadR family transcriptional regulator, regulatory protein PadR